ncbi:hypothetical protein GA707_16670 [Nostocoides sp. F2B08]|uniref:hypothetical protein n=1 Tax=Nostocoides sp. F2B08 TaxID=2653936 RepID=UPI0012632A02|nr:hypothetical protein [Tetrasphaera sp. F2B08]KAB7741848.1 hypothetical protein GA707_16670 [Tetrasphaera sp. F2B08]
MRWQGLFDDLDGQWAAEERRDRDAEVADRTRAERARVALAERCAASRGAVLGVWTVTGEPLEGTLVDLGADWLLLRDGAGRELLVASAAMTAVTGLSRHSDPAVTSRRFALGYALRALSRDRASVIVTDRSGGRVSGTIDAVGQDWFDLSEHPVDEPRRTGALTGRRTIATWAVVSVLSASATRDDERY